MHFLRRFCWWRCTTIGVVVVVLLVVVMVVLCGCGSGGGSFSGGVGPAGLKKLLEYTAGYLYSYASSMYRVKDRPMPLTALE